MAFRLLADALVILHLAFVAFVLLGGLLALRDRRWLWLHLPAVAWVAYAELTATTCPLTPLENAWRLRAGDAAYAGGFVDQYLLPVLYPAGLTPRLQWMLGLAVLALNGAIYALVWRKRQRLAAV